MRALWIVALMLFLAPPPASTATSTDQFAGDWIGAVDIGGMKLPMVVHLSESGGKWSGSMDSPDQGAYGIPFSAVTVDGAKLHIGVSSIGGAYDGTLSSDGATITGTWSQGPNALPLELKRGDASSLPGRNRPQEPKPPFPYRSEEVAISVPGGHTLAGTLTMPEGPGPFPAVILISGSGPQDRDESLFNHRPFLVLSDYMTRNGLAVLRVDDRGTAKSTGNFATATTREFALDAHSEVEFLKARKDIDGQHIGLVGHSEGGLVAPIVASSYKDVAFIVLMAGVGVRAEDIMVRQSSLMMKANGASDAMVAANSAAVHRMCTIVMTEKDSTAARTKLEAVADSLVAAIAALDPAAGAAAEQSVGQSIDVISSPWYRYWLTIDPAETLRKVRVPVLAINGSLDLQVDPKQNLPVIEKALRDGGNRDVTIVEMPGLNHLFQTAKTGLVTEYMTIEETMSPVAMKTITDWILVRTKPAKQ